MSATIAPAPGAPAAETVESGRGRTRLLLGVLLVALVGAAVWFFLLAPEAEAGDPGDVPEGAIVALEPQTTTTGTAALHHARVALALVLVEGADESVVTARSPLLQEVAAMDADQLRSAAGSDQLRANLTEHAQRIWPDGEVRRVVLTELLVQ